MTLNRIEEGDFLLDSRLDDTVRDLPALAAATTTSFPDAPSFTDSKAVMVQGLQKLGVQCKFTGVAGSTGNTIFRFIFSVDGVTFDSSFSYEITMTQAGATEVVSLFSIPVEHVKFIKLLEIQNTDAADALSNLNVKYYGEEWA